MDKQKVENKFIYFISLLGMVMILVLIAYFFFLRNVEVDIMDNAQYTYVGENGNASVVVSAKQGELNQRMQDFLNSVKYEVSPSSDLSNGDTIHVTATYDEALANQYHYKPKSIEANVVVEGLANRYLALQDIPKTLIQDGRNAALDYVKENQDAIYKLDGKEEKTPSLDKMKIVYSAYLKSNQKKNSDRFVYIVQMTYDSEVLYYMVCIPNINDSNEIDTHNIYGEKAYLTQEELDGKDFNGYVDRVYSSKYQIEQKKNKEVDDFFILVYSLILQNQVFRFHEIQS
ncbi:hypothetical protein [Holdemanella biformis]|uniref:hypothetical protein n=2 Tax=Holdemanella biformis TaxID=1735 RepID=UPI002490B9BC|nr:hypothetical protein [Holdemanella biformis]